MSELATLAMDAHGGLARWRELKTVSARLVQGGVLWKLKGHDGTMGDIHLTVDLRTEKASHWPFERANRHTSFRPDRIAIETSDGDVVEERFNPRESFKDHRLETPWDRLQLAYFAGYAMWTYLNTPFLFALPGVTTEEIEPWQENGEVWRCLRATFAPAVATHSKVQTFYFDPQGLLKRHDYDVEVSAGAAAAHYVSDLKQFSGITVPTRRRVFGRAADGKAVPTPLLVSIDLSEIEFT